MSYMFYGCSFLKELKASSFIINDETNMSDMFYGCHNELKKMKFILKKKNLKLNNLSFLILLISLIYYFK